MSELCGDWVNRPIRKIGVSSCIIDPIIMVITGLGHIIRTFGNRCLSAIGGGNRWSRFAGWVQLSAEAAWPPRNTTSATLCAQVTMRLFFGLQYDFLNHNDVMIIGTYFFLRKGTRKITTDTKMG